MYIFVVESYEKIVVDKPDLQSRYKPMMQTFERTLQSGGCYSTTNYSMAPVSGGASWLSTLTILSGEEIDNQLSYDYYVTFHTPDMVTWFKHQGHHTVLLQSPTRKRPGLPVSDMYHFDHSILFDDLHYGGPKYGWGIIPDQFSLHKAYGTYIQHSIQPYLFFFTMVSSHAPWSFESLPPYITNPTSEQQLLDAYASSWYRSKDMTITRKHLKATNALKSRYLAFIRYEL